METLEKLRFLIDKEIVSRYELAKDLGMSKSTLTNYYEGKTTPSSLRLDVIETYINKRFGSNLNCSTEKQQDSPLENNNYTLHYDDLKGKAIPHIDVVTASCGLPNGFNSAITKGDCERYIIPDMPGCDFTIRAGGRSMINRDVPERSINDRDIVGCRIVTTRSHVRWGEVYALATYDGIMIKKVEESEQEGYIRCVPFNKEEGFKPYDVPVNEIHDWALVVGVVSVKTWI